MWVCILVYAPQHAPVCVSVFLPCVSLPPLSADVLQPPSATLMCSHLPCSYILSHWKNRLTWQTEWCVQLQLLAPQVQSRLSRSLKQHTRSQLEAVDKMLMMWVYLSWMLVSLPGCMVINYKLMPCMLRVKLKDIQLASNCQKLQFLQWPHVAVSTNESVPMSKSPASQQTLTACY